jgi:hypothetical protein
MSFEQIGSTDIATDGPAISMPGYIHDPAFTDIIFRVVLGTYFTS